MLEKTLTIDNLRKWGLTWLVLFFLKFFIGNQCSYIDKKKYKGKQWVHDDEHKRTKKEKGQRSSCYSKRDKELYAGWTIRETPTSRPIKKSSLAQIF